MNTNVIDATDATVEGLIAQEGISIVDLWAPWCGPCRVYGPILEEYANEVDPSVKIIKVNVDENPTFSAKHGIRSIPTTILFKNGQIISKIPGVIQKAKLNEFVTNLL